MRVSFFANLRSSEPLGRDVSWPKLSARLLVASQGIRSKAECPLWSPARWPEASTRRLGRLVESISALCLDYDGTRAFEDAKARWAEYEALIHTTWSHTEEEPRLRVVVPLATSINAGIWSAVYRATVEADGGAADPACCDPGRVFLLPAVGPSKIYRAEAWPGKRLDLSELAEELNFLSNRVWEQRYQHKPSWKPKPVWTYNDGRRRYVVRQRMAEDPEVRENLGRAWGGSITERPSGTVVNGLECPGCGRDSAWYLVDPRSFRGAACHHRSTCGWAGPLWALSEAY